MKRLNEFNNWLALKITAGVGTMWCAWIFAGLACVSLPATLAAHSLIVLVAWVAQTFLQLVLLSILAVGQRLSDEKHTATQQSLAGLHDKHDALHQHLGIEPAAD